MDSFFIRMIVVFVIVFLLNTGRQILVRRSTVNKVEMPHRIQRIGLAIFVILTFSSVLMVLMGLLTRHAESTIVSLVLLAISLLLTFGTRRKYKRFYKETDEYFMLEDEYSAYQIYYEDIIDWVPASKQIGILDGTEEKERYIFVNLVFADPEILLRKLTEMTFSGKFSQTDANKTGDPKREQEFVEHLQKNGYGNIVEEFAQE